MPANSRVFLKPFIGGLNTEGSDTDDMVLNTSDELNCTILPEQMRGRRYGFNIERDGVWIDTNENITAHCVYHWNNVEDDLNYVVVQANRKIYIFKDVQPISLNNLVITLNLDSYPIIVAGQPTTPLAMTSISNELFIVGKWVIPFVVKYNSAIPQFELTYNNLKFRDFNGIEEHISVDYTPTLSELTQEHLYNLYNQGWDKKVYNPQTHVGSSLVTPTGGVFYDTANVFPANNMQWFLGKQNSGSYNTYDLLNTYFGNTPAPKGHYIIDYIHRSRTHASGIYLLSSQPDTASQYSKTKRIWIPWDAPYNNWLSLFGHPGGYQVSTYWPADYKFVHTLPAEFTGPVEGLLVSIKDILEFTWENVVYPYREYSNLVNYMWQYDLNLKIYGINGSTKTLIKTEVLDRTSVTRSDTYTQYLIDLRDPQTQQATSYGSFQLVLEFPAFENIEYFWPSMDYTIIVAQADPSTQEVVTTDGLPSSDLLQGAVTDVESFGGRIFYLCNNTVLFSQTLSTDNKNYDKCYQEADPTSEEVSDVVATDGGMIQLLSLGRGKALKSFYRGVLVFGDKEVTGVISNSINLFSADSYDVVKITTAGLEGQYTVVETDNAVFYWSQHGIYMISIDENNNISSNCISVNTIQNWYMNLDQVSKENAVGYYDYANNRIYWFYPTTVDIEKFDGCLVYDLTFNSFMPQSIDAGHVVRDLSGNYVGIIDKYLSKLIKSNNKSEDIVIDDNVIYDKNGEIVGYTQPNYITDCCETASVNYISPTYYLRAGGDRVVAGPYKVNVGNSKDKYYDRKSAGIYLISDGTRFSFGDFNDREFRDWDISPYNSYMVSRPITLGDTYFNKQTPVMQTLFKRTEEYKLKERSDVYVTTYSLEPYRMKVSDGKIRSYTDILNAGKFIKTYITLDFTDFTDTISEIDIKIVGRKNDSVYIGTQTLHNITSTTKYTTMVECFPEYADQEFDRFSIQIKVTPNSSEDLHDIDEVCTFILNRTRIDEKKFKGYKEVSVTGHTSLENIQDNDYKISFKTVEGKLKDATITFSPLILSWSYPVLWDADLLALLAGPAEVPTGINTTVEGQTGNYILSGAPDSGVLLFDQFSIVMNNIQVHGGALSFVTVSYDLTLLAPEYEDFAIIKSADYTTPSGAIIRMRWGWSVDPLSNRWDMMQNGYRPQKDFLHDDYVESRMHIRGRGKAFQVEIRNDDNKDFRLTGLNIITRSPQ